MIERSRVRIPAGTAGEFSSPGSTFCADLFRYPFHPRVTTVARKMVFIISLFEIDISVHVTRDV